ncbi:MAG: NADH:ubiquinone reductase (Na(+)-transporting) subunit C [Culturomica sp.]|jgi:Na+-transporting NADH:ubiquinone oxidoreductase subunit C|nr:NADH:ubiquinone reductase (Na(+)-transporting) subunit C [Culturomica sp.]
MNRQGNLYTFIYSIVLVVLVAALLSIIAMWLQPTQNENIENEKRQKILSSINISSTREESKALFEKYIINQFVVNSKGDTIKDENAFTLDLAVEAQKPCEEKLMPVFVANIDGAVKYILPVYGKGLWGPIWGYISMNEDKNSIYGAVFDHKGETPGLGAEIATPAFSNQFDGKTVFENGEMVAIEVEKGHGHTGTHEVDGISGGTITSKGVENMLKTYLNCYESFLKK